MLDKILILEDNELLLETLEDILENEGYECELAKDGEEALKKSYDNKYCLYLLDVKVPFVNGFDFLKELRDAGDRTPAIFITSLIDKESLSQGFSSGCDDYIKKPFDLDELLLRIRAVLKRVNPDEIIKIDEEFSFNTKRMRLIKNENEIDLNLKDAKLLLLLLKERGRVVTAEMINDTLWDKDKSGSSGAVRVYINNLKKILGKKRIINIRGLGYKFE